MSVSRSVCEDVFSLRLCVHYLMDKRRQMCGATDPSQLRIREIELFAPLASPLQAWGTGTRAQWRSQEFS